MIGKTISHYKILQKIGGGGMGAVYKAEDLSLGRTVALKFIHPELITDEQHKKRFLREARAASAIEHPNIYNIFEVGETAEGRPFICMAYYGDNSLARRMDGSPFPARELFQIGFSIAQGLDCAHRNDIIHRDIKPSNVVITQEGFIKIVDFGLAKLANTTKITHSGTTVGTVRYMSPEQASGEPVDRRTDIWALGVILFELATGRSPFRGELDQAIVYSVLHDEIPPVTDLNPDIPEAGARIIARCLERDVNKRYQSAEELLADMAGMAGALGWGSSIAGLSVPALESRRRRVRRHRIRAAVITTVVAATALFTWWWNTREPPLYVTDVRLAVMPLDNKTHPSHDPLVAGLSRVVYEMLDEASRHHDSMWVAWDAVVRYANLAGANDAREAFGVNYVVTGDVQRHATGHLLLLEWRDSETMERIRTVTVPFAADAPAALADSLTGAVVALIDADLDTDDLSRLLPDVPGAIRSYLSGTGKLAGGDTDAAIGALEQVTNRIPGFASGHHWLGWANWQGYLATGIDPMYDRSLEHLEAAASLDSAYWQPRFSLGDIHRMTGNDSLAVAAFESVLKIAPGNPLACRGLARVYRGQDRYDEAEKILQTAIDNRPDYYFPVRVLAYHFYLLDEGEQAEQLFHRSLSLAPNNAYSHNMLGVLFHERGMYTEARIRFEQAFQLLPDCHTCSNIGLMLYYEKRYRESSKYYEYALEYCDKDNPETWGNWASSLYWVDGEKERAIELFQTAIGILEEQLEDNPDNPDAIAGLIEYYAMSGDEQNARRMIARAEPYASTNAEIMYAIGDAYEIFGDRTSALRYIANSIRHDYPVARIVGTRELKGLVEDPRFQRLIQEKSLPETTQGE
jgi:serine/threonine-protein kinase